jgi:hypothetical protein
VELLKWHWGLKTRLDKVSVTSLSARLSPSPGLSPGQSGRLAITATASDGKQLVTVGPGHGTVLFDSFTFDATVVSVNKKGIVSSGSEGSKGFDGSNGIDGSAGSNGSIDLTNPSAGGSGTIGTSGGDGGNGGPGQPGEAVHIWVTLTKDASPLLQVRAASSKHEQFFLVDPNGGTLAVDANGGTLRQLTWGPC